MPTLLLPLLLLDLHKNHMGVVRMKSIARPHFWRRNLNAEVEEMARKRQSCMEQDPIPAKGKPTPTSNWPGP